MKEALHYMDFRQGDLIQKELARVVFLVHDTSSRYDLAICEVYEYIPYCLGVLSRTLY